MNILSLFDGISCLQVSLKLNNINIENYFASEINDKSISITNYNFKNTIQLGDVTKLKLNLLPTMKLISAGSPCTDFSIAGKKRGLSSNNVEILSLEQYLTLKNSNFNFTGQSYLFWEFINVLRNVKHEYFLLENTLMDKRWENLITENLGVEPILINSSRFSCQNRKRLYWTNIPVDLPLPDYNIKFNDVIPYGKPMSKHGYKPKGSDKYEVVHRYMNNGKCNCLLTSPDSTNRIAFNNTDYSRPLSVEECELIQTLPKGYTDVPGISDKDKYHGIGNGWTINVIRYLLKNLK